MIRAARQIWDETGDICSTLTENYLHDRGITIKPSKVRHHPSLRHFETGLCLPAMVAAVQNVNGEFQAVHRTFLSPVGKGKAAVSTSKKMLGPVGGGAVRLAAVAPELLIGEGIETVLSAMEATGMPGWACLSTGGLRSLHLPEEVRAVIILEDADDPGREAAAAAAQRLIREGRTVRVAPPPAGFKDFNDVLLEGVA
jgi:hypothetical protein